MEKQNFRLPDVDNVPNGFNDSFARIINQIERPASTNTQYCRMVLSMATLAYRPLQLLKLGAMSGLSNAISSSVENIRKIIEKSGFLKYRSINATKHRLVSTSAWADVLINYTTN